MSKANSCNTVILQLDRVSHHGQNQRLSKNIIDQFYQEILLVNIASHLEFDLFFLF